MEQQSPTTVIYRSGTNHSLGAGWDVIQVIYQAEDHGVKRTVDSVLLARDVHGIMIRKTNVLPNRWEQVTDPATLRRCEDCFDKRDKLATAMAKRQSPLGPASSPQILPDRR